MTTPTRTAITEALEGRHLLEHPFYRRWESGELVDGELTAYAEQYRFFETALPSFLAQLAHQLPDGIAREAVLENLSDEVATPSHLDLFASFAEHYNATRAAMSPAMTQLIEAYQNVLTVGPTTALAGLLAYEIQAADIATSKADGLRQHYGANDNATAFWDAHSVLESTHADWTIRGLESLDASSSDVTRGARVVANAWWDFLTERNELVGV